jgi:hypothetical protein
MNVRLQEHECPQSPRWAAALYVVVAFILGFERVGFVCTSKIYLECDTWSSSGAVAQRIYSLARGDLLGEAG